MFNQRVYLISLSVEKTPLTYETKQRTWIRIFLALSSEKDTNGGLNRFPWTENKSPASSSLFRGTFFKSISICNLSARYYKRPFFQFLFFRWRLPLIGLRFVLVAAIVFWHCVRNLFLLLVFLHYNTAGVCTRSAAH